MELHEIFFETDEVRLHGMEGPASGPPLVLLHGATGSCGDWMGIISSLAENWHIYTFDLRGHGLSGRPGNLEGYNLSHNVADTLSLLRDVVREPAVLMGHSYGAVISALSAGPAAEWLRGIILEDPPLMLRRDDLENSTFIDHFNILYHLRKSTDKVDDILAAFSAQNPSAPVEALRLYAQNIAWLDPNYLLAITHGNKHETARGVDFAAHTSAIRCPVLLMQADTARGATLVQKDLDFFMARAPHSQLVTFPGSGHGIHSEQPDRFLQVFAEFTANLA